MAAQGETFSDMDVSAYIDGELPAHESAAFVRRMSRDSDLAERVATLTYLKSELRALDPAPGVAPPDLSALWPSKERAATGNPSTLWRIRAAAAAIVMLMLVGGAWAFMPHAVEPNSYISPDVVEAAVLRHREWMGEPATGSGGNGQPLTLASFARHNTGVYVPDLGASGLTVAGTERFDGDGARVGYVGVHDCRLSLFILPDPGAVPSALRERDAQDARVFVWSTVHLDYVLVAAGMDPTRLDLISKAVLEATKHLQPFSVETKLALDLNHRQARSCNFS